jgi:ABC-type phosphate/phosphonate transport system substrate-binding protein
MRVVRFAVAAQKDEAEAGLLELRAAVAAVCPIDLEALYLPGYAALTEHVMKDTECVAWVAPLVALDLMNARAASPLVSIGRKGRTTYYAALVASAASRITEVAGLRGARAGWVSPESASGYMVPRLYLRALGMRPEETFASEQFFATHARLARALVDDEVDVIATHAAFRSGPNDFELEPALARETILATVGPIPGDVFVAARGLDAATKVSLQRALLATSPRQDGPLAQLIHVERFEVASPSHFEALRRWTRRAEKESPHQAQ